jgi:hypothetical protein
MPKIILRGFIVHYGTWTFKESRTTCTGLTRFIVHQGTWTFKNELYWSLDDHRLPSLPFILLTLQPQSPAKPPAPSLADHTVGTLNPGDWLASVAVFKVACATAQRLRDRPQFHSKRNRCCRPHGWDPESRCRARFCCSF